MPAFIDPTATASVELAACYCPGGPHERDAVTIRTQYGYGDLLELSSVHTDAGRIDAMGERAKLLHIGIRGWTFVDDEGQPVEVSLINIMLLHPQVVEPIATAIDEAFNASAPPLPNAFGARSQPSSPASSSARTTKRSRRR